MQEFPVCQPMWHPLDFARLVVLFKIPFHILAILAAVTVTIGIIVWSPLPERQAHLEWILEDWECTFRNPVHSFRQAHRDRARPTPFLFIRWLLIFILVIRWLLVIPVVFNNF